MPIRRLAALMLLLLQPAVAAAQGLAPLPPHWMMEEPGGEEELRGLRGVLTGIYGHGFNGSTAGLTCTGDAAAQAAYRARIGEARSEFWVYMTRSDGILFERRLIHQPDQRCDRPLLYDTMVDRAFLTDGVIHSFELGDDGYTLEQGGTASATRDNSEYWLSVPFLHSLLARARERPRGGVIVRNTRAPIAGHPARCIQVGGLAWSIVCRTQAPGLARGMIVRTLAGDDEGMTFFDMRFDRLDPDARLDPRLFDMAWRWNVPQGAPRR